MLQEQPQNVSTKQNLSFEPPVNLKEKIKQYLSQDEVSIVTPDVKKLGRTYGISCPHSKRKTRELILINYEGLEKNKKYIIER